MKKLLCLLAVWPMFILFSCSSDNGDDLSLNKTNLQLASDVKAQLEASEKVEWSSESNFVASVDDKGMVVGNHVGKTFIVASNGGYKAKCEVEVIALHNTLTEPIIDFGASLSVIKSKETRTLFKEDSKSLFYKDDKSDVVQGIIYSFTSGKLKDIGLLINLSYTSVATDFFLERYQPFTESDGTYIMINNDFKNYTAGVCLYVKKDFLLAVYMPSIHNTKMIGLPQEEISQSLIDRYSNIVEN